MLLDDCYPSASSIANLLLFSPKLAPGFWLMRKV